MDPRQFDDLVKRLAIRTTRRNALKVFGGGILAGTLGRLRSSTADAAPKGKVGICHRTGSASNPVVFITVNVNAIPAHQAHGDVIDPDFQNDPANCGGCSISCDDGDPCTIDTCVAGACVNTQVDCSELDDQCLLGVCVGGTCEAQSANEGGACEDGNACTTNDTCVAGVCTGGPKLDCDDGNACTTDSCDPASGCVHEDVICDDGDACTTDSCDPASGCVSVPVDCPVGQACLDGECIGCAGGTCENLPFGCDGDDGCVCFITTEDVGFCHRGEPCEGLQTCNTSADCTNPDHPACSTATCCGDIHVCIRPCEGTGFAPLAPENSDGGPTTVSK